MMGKAHVASEKYGRMVYMRNVLEIRCVSYFVISYHMWQRNKKEGAFKHLLLIPAMGFERSQRQYRCR